MMVNTPAEQMAEKAVGGIVSRGEAYLQDNHVPLDEWPAYFRAILEGARLANVFCNTGPIEDVAAMRAAIVKAQNAFGG